MEQMIATVSGATMLSAPTPNVGLDLAVAHRPDVAVLDLDLPGTGGYDLLQRLRAIPATRSTPVLALAAARSSTEAGTALKAGFFRHLTEPFDVQAVLAAIGDALDTARRGPGAAAVVDAPWQRDLRA